MLNKPSILVFMAAVAMPGIAAAQVAITLERHSVLTDDDLLNLPQDVEQLSLRGSRGYGADRITDTGIAHLTRYPHLRILRAGGFELTDACLESISKMAQLEELALDSNSITGSGLPYLGACEKLKKLNLSFNPLTRASFDSLSQLDQLRELSVVASSVTVDDRILEVCSKLRRLETLLLSAETPGVTDRGLVAIARLHRLKNLSLGGARVTGEGLRSLESLSSLERLELRSLFEVAPGSLTGLVKHPKLRSLRIEQMHLNQHDLRAINELGKLEELVLWNVFGAEPSEAAIEKLDGLHSLRSIRTNERLSGSALQDLAQAQGLASISDELREITDEELGALARLPKLRMLSLDSDKITERSLTTLARMSALRMLYISPRVRISAAQLKALGKEALPHCQIQQFYPPYTVFHRAESLE